MSKKKQQLKDRSNLFKFESITIRDEEMDDGWLKPNRVHLATLISFVIFELMLLLSHFYGADYSIVQFVSLSVVALILARQIALDFAYHILLEIYNVPLIIMSIFIPSLVFDQGSITQSIIAGFGLFGFFLVFTLIASWLKGQIAGIGGGDILFAFAIGGFLQGFLIFISMFLSSMLSLVLTFFYKDKKNVPMGPGLLVSFWLCLLYNEQIIDLLNKYLG
ncbi:MAG TPA: hypothetical protein DCL21_04090 [Alphaproteobacteria bacterium]|nr:hypothetical protein [Alphaproteobacteria bacterium]